MACRNQPLYDKLLDGVEGLFEIVGILYGGGFIPDFVAYLCKRRPTQFKGVFRQVDVVYRTGLPVEYGLHDLSDIRAAATGGDDNRTGGNDIPIGILLFHGERILTRRDVDAERNGKVGAALYRVV